MIKAFHLQCQEKPSFVCAICNRLLFKKQVKHLNICKYRNIELIQKCIELNQIHVQCEECVEKEGCKETCQQCAKWICTTCDSNLSRNKVPIQASCNNLSLPPLPDFLNSLNQIERHLISPIIPFMKIIALPRGQQKGIHGPVVCVPSNVSTVTQLLPRALGDSSFVKVKLKRKMEYKGHHLYQQVYLPRIEAALQYLKANCPHFKGIFLYINFSEMCLRH
jgi:hypothetical protein